MDVERVLLGRSLRVSLVTRFLCGSGEDTICMLIALDWLLFGLFVGYRGFGLCNYEWFSFYCWEET